MRKWGRVKIVTADDLAIPVKGQIKCRYNGDSLNYIWNDVCAQIVVNINIPTRNIYDGTIQYYEWD